MTLAFIFLTNYLTNWQVAIRTNWRLWFRCSHLF